MHTTFADEADRAQMLTQFTSPASAVPRWCRRLGRELLPSVAGGVEDQRVKIDDSSSCIDEDAARRQAGVGVVDVAKPVETEHQARTLQILARER